jgi:hypothetical protein
VTILSKRRRKANPKTFFMFWNVVSLLSFILLGVATKCGSVGAITENLELANFHLQTGEMYDIVDEHQHFTFRLSIFGPPQMGDQRNDRFRVHTSLQWENLTLDRVNETIVLNSSNYSPAFDDFCRLLTDGENMYVEKQIVIFYPFGSSSSYSIDPDGFEQTMFENQTGCSNGVDFHGNYIDSIALTIKDFERMYKPPPRDDWASSLNLSLVFNGRPLLPNELDIAVVGPLGKMRGYADNNLTTMHFSAEKGSRWATLEFMIDWNTVVVGEPITSVHEFGTHNIRELITDGDNGYIQFDFFFRQDEGRAYWESSFFERQPGCFNGVDLEGNHVQEISLLLNEGSEYKVWESGGESCTVVPKFVFAGRLGDGPTVCPDCECESECEDVCDDALPKHTVATTLKILVLLTGWAWFQM